MLIDVSYDTPPYTYGPLVCFALLSIPAYCNVNHTDIGTLSMAYLSTPLCTAISYLRQYELIILEPQRKLSQSEGPEILRCFGHREAVEIYEDAVLPSESIS